VALEEEHQGALDKHTQGAMVAMQEAGPPMEQVVGTHLSDEHHTCV
jgi:hypothetical protein